MATVEPPLTIGAAELSLLASIPPGQDLIQIPIGPLHPPAAQKALQNLVLAGCFVLIDMGLTHKQELSGVVTTITRIFRMTQAGRERLAQLRISVT